MKMNRANIQSMPSELFENYLNCKIIIIKKKNPKDSRSVNGIQGSSIAASR